MYVDETEQEAQKYFNLTVVTWKVSTAAAASLVVVGPAVVNVSKSSLRVHISVKIWYMVVLIWYDTLRYYTYFK